MFENENLRVILRQQKNKITKTLVFNNWKSIDEYFNNTPIKPTNQLLAIYKLRHYKVYNNDKGLY